MRTLRSESEVSDIVREHRSVFFYFTASWCGPCKRVRPLCEEFDRDKSALFVTVDVDDHPDLCEAWKVDSVPAVRVYVHGQRVAQQSVDEDALRGLAKLYA